MNFNFKFSSFTDCFNLLMWCLDLIPEDRPTLDEILSHDWLMEGVEDWSAESVRSSLIQTAREIILRKTDMISNCFF